MRRPRVARRPDHWSSPHERARSLSAEALVATPAAADSAWLAGHLQGCDECRAVATAYAADQQALRSLRTSNPEPPRDLWARTAAGIEAEAARGGRSVRRRRAGSGVPVGALSGLAVIAIVVGVAALSNGAWGTIGQGPELASVPASIAIASPRPTALVPGATPIAIAPTQVSWVHLSADGGYAYNSASVNQVCPADDRPGCAALDDATAKHLAIKNAPRVVIGSPTERKAIVVSTDAAGHDQVLVLALPRDESSAPSASPSATASPTPTSPAPTSATPSATLTHTAPPTASPGATPSPTLTSQTPTPTTSETGSVEPTSSALSSPSTSPEPTVAAELAIASGVTVVGDSAAFTSDGLWFAFTARPADGSAGPDIYVWRVGDPSARALTTDGLSVFASWVGDQLVGSRPMADDLGGDLGGDQHAPTSFILDPATGVESGAPIRLWRPAVDPTGRFAVGWTGTIATASTGQRLSPADGALIVTTWQPDGSTSATGSKLTPDGGHLTDFDVRWDETGSWLAVWIADPADSAIGRLTLYHLDRDSGVIDQVHGAPEDVAALAGFSIGDGRLAWVTPAGQDAQGSRVQVAAWSATGVGVSETVPGEDVVVVR